MKKIARKHYLEKLSRLRGTPDIKVLTGVRRAGKSTLLKDWGEALEREGANVVKIDFADLSNEPLTDYHELHRHAEAHKATGRENVLMIDEVQACPEFERAINSLHARGGWDIYLTGSNAFLLSSDLATLFTGRQIGIPVLPFSFSEYQLYFPGNDIQRAFDEYLVTGGLAGSYAYRTERDRTSYVREVFETILVRDLTEKYRLSEPTVLRHLAEYLMDNIANLTNPHRTSVQLAQNKVATNHATAGTYIEHLRNAFLFYPVKRYDIHGRKYLATSEKYYLCDLGFRDAVLGRRNMDYGRAYENLVYLELSRRGYDVHVGKLYGREIDFVAVRGGEKLYIQVADDISGNETRTRETAPLLSIRDAYPKMLLARTRHEEYDVEGIRVVDLADWLGKE
ncbi:MAG: ATP-binding protein [Kiritimatiellae bacterium]|nr:ATP-binding protein [Kiritimatiellia bacterium]